MIAGRERCARRGLQLPRHIPGRVSPDCGHKRPTHRTRLSQQCGFTLLEMVLVVFIMGTLAAVSLSFIENENHQQRFEDTRKRLMSINRAVVGEGVAQYGGESQLSGYAVDNGVLPGSIDNVLNKPTDYDDYALQDPVFDPNPDATTGLNNGGGTALNGTGEQLFKGFRRGYLAVPPTTTGSAYRDGWGRDFIVTTGPPLVVTSMGADGVDNNPEVAGLSSDISTAVADADWQVDIASWQVTLTNSTGVDIDTFTSGTEGMRLSLLVYENDGDAINAYNWRRFTTNELIDCLDGDGDGLVGASVCTSFSTLTFPVGGYPGGTLDTKISQGRHLLVLIEDDNTTHDGVGEIPCGTARCKSTIPRTTYQVILHARTVLPQINVVIR